MTLEYYRYRDLCSYIENKFNTQLDNKAAIDNWESLKFKNYCYWLWKTHGVNYHSIKNKLYSHDPEYAHLSYPQSLQQTLGPRPQNFHIWMTDVYWASLGIDAKAGAVLPVNWSDALEVSRLKNDTWIESQVRLFFQEFDRSDLWIKLDYLG